MYILIRSKRPLIFPILNPLHLLSMFEVSLIGDDAMAEIKSADIANVCKVLSGDFNVPDQHCYDYASIAVFLSSSEEFKAALKQVDIWLKAAFVGAENWLKVAPDSKADSGKQAYNRLSRIIFGASNVYGWDSNGNLVLSGFTEPAHFVKYVKGKRMWKDMVASTHGEFSHPIQWITIASGLKLMNSAATLFSRSCDYKTNFGVGNDRKLIYLWDFLVDCYPQFGNPDWRNSIRTGTFRSPNNVTAELMAGKYWLGTMLNERYRANERNWSVPTNPPPQNYPIAPESPSARGHRKHLDYGQMPKPSNTSTNPQPSPEDRAENIFPGQKGYTAYQSTISSRGNPATATNQELAKKAGYVFERKDDLLSKHRLSFEPEMIVAMKESKLSIPPPKK